MPTNKQVALVDVRTLFEAASHEVTFDHKGNTIWLKLAPDAEPHPPGPADEAIAAWLAEAIEDWNLAEGKKKLLIRQKILLRRIPRALFYRIRDEVQKALSPSLQVVEGAQEQPINT